MGGASLLTLIISSLSSFINYCASKSVRRSLLPLVSSILFYVLFSLVSVSSDSCLFMHMRVVNRSSVTTSFSPSSTEQRELVPLFTLSDAPRRVIYVLEKAPVRYYSSSMTCTFALASFLSVFLSSCFTLTSFAHAALRDFCRLDSNPRSILQTYSVSQAP